MVKNAKSGSIGSEKGKKSQMQGVKFRTLQKFRRCEILHPAKNFSRLRNLHYFIFLPLLLLFPSNFLSTMLSSTQILHAWIDSTNLALIACKNYKISHKMRSVE